MTRHGGAARTGTVRHVALLPLAAAALVLACRTAEPPALTPPRQAPAPAAVATPVAATPAPTPAPTPPPVRFDLVPPLIRVLLASGPEVALPDPGRRYAAVGDDGGTTVIRGPLRATASPTRPAVQAGAFARPENARTACERLRAAGLDAHVESAPDGLQRVVVVGSAGGDAGALRDRLAGLGIAGATPRGGVGGTVVVAGEDGAQVSSAQFRLVPLDADPVRVGAGRYRGEFVVRPSAEGVAVIDVLALEAYLRGVVPAEMGPRSFPAIEALKAQAVAARTYAVAHLHEHDAEGYDICATQACQVYGGADVEHPLTDRAVAETAGQIVVYDGKPIDAMYQSTCGGHTEDAAAVMPERAAPYLRGVLCRAESSAPLGTGQRRGGWLDAIGRLTEVGGRIGASLGARGAGASALTRALTGRMPGAGEAGLLRAFALEGALGLLHGAGGGVAWEQATALLDTFHLPLPPRPEGGPQQQRWELALAVRLGQLSGVIETFSGRLVAGPAGYRVYSDRVAAARDLTGGEFVLEEQGDAWRAGPVAAPLGSAATLWCARGMCPVLEVEPRREADSGSAWGWWVREIPLDVMGAKLSVPAVRGVRVTRRGESGRALALEVDTAAGRRELAGFPFRRALGLPDTLFTVTVRSTASGPVAHFVGRGWGHGIGMCQNGAFGLAQGGASYDQILRTYYTGVALATWGVPTGGSR